MLFTNRFQGYDAINQASFSINGRLDDVMLTDPQDQDDNDKSLRNQSIKLFLAYVGVKSRSVA